MSAKGFNLDFVGEEVYTTSAFMGKLFPHGGVFFFSSESLPFKKVYQKRFVGCFRGIVSEKICQNNF